MNSIIEIRKTFGIIDPATGKRYGDILYNTLRTIEFTSISLTSIETLLLENRYYSLYMEPCLITELTELFLKDKNSERKILAVVSFQVRTDGYIAVARLYQANLDSRKKGD